MLKGQGRYFCRLCYIIAVQRRLLQLYVWPIYTAQPIYGVHHYVKLPVSSLLLGDDNKIFQFK